MPGTGIAFLLVAPLVALAIPSFGFWADFKAAKQSRRPVKRATYPRIYFSLLIVGVVCMWICWVGSTILLVVGVHPASVGFLSFTTRLGIIAQAVGLLVFYCGAIAYNWSLIAAGKYLRPAPSGIYEDHRLVREGPYGVVRHPLYVSYILISSGLGLTFLAPWMFIGTLCLVVGIHPTAKAEEEVLVEQFGEQYIDYQHKVGMLFPGLF
jgi:protein-S-isoprenylcysteine O-methyltransferase Ste14